MKHIISFKTSDQINQSTFVKTRLGNIYIDRLTIKRKAKLDEKIHVSVDECDADYYVTNLFSCVCLLKEGMGKDKINIPLEKIKMLTNSELDNIALVYIECNEHLNKKSTKKEEENDKGEIIVSWEYEGIEYPKSVNESYVDYLHRLCILEESRIYEQIKNAAIGLDYSGLLKPFEDLAKNISFDIEPIVSSLRGILDGLPEQIQTGFISLGTRGWFIDFEIDLPTIAELEKMISKDEIVEVDKSLVAFYEQNINEIEKFIVDNFPNRKKLLNSAFKAHNRKEYELSIPVFFSQIDGICKEVIGEYFFMSHNKKPRTYKYAEKFESDSIRFALLSPLAQKLPVNYSGDQRGSNSKELNRHLVMHGESIDYGTQVNSVKAISLLNYIVHALKRN